ncbi:hypothetical protein VCHA53O466_50552 [Vibrio chagasii]|nr:hypothetical protein VCHA53O466_50552 [Vibrio chagasii]
MEGGEPEPAPEDIDPELEGGEPEPAPEDIEPELEGGEPEPAPEDIEPELEGGEPEPAPDNEIAEQHQVVIAETILIDGHTKLESMGKEIIKELADKEGFEFKNDHDLTRAANAYWRSVAELNGDSFDVHNIKPDQSFKAIQLNSWEDVKGLIENTSQTGDLIDVLESGEPSKHSLSVDNAPDEFKFNTCPMPETEFVINSKGKLTSDIFNELMSSNAVSHNQYGAQVAAETVRHFNPETGQIDFTNMSERTMDIVTRIDQNTLEAILSANTSEVAIDVDMDILTASGIDVSQQESFEAIRKDIRSQINASDTCSSIEADNVASNLTRNLLQNGGTLELNGLSETEAEIVNGLTIDTIQQSFSDNATPSFQQSLTDAVEKKQAVELDTTPTSEPSEKVKKLRSLSAGGPRGGGG